MEFKQLESFVAVVTYKSFTKAAQHLYISQPTISFHIQSLEEELKSKLILRTTKSIEITPRGMELYDCACSMLAQRDQLIKSWFPETKKVIQLGASTIPSAYIVPEILPEFGKLYPDVYFNVHQNDSQGIIDDMQNGKYDVGMVGMPCESKMLTSVPFYQDEIVLITPVNDDFLALKEQGEITPDILTRYPMILRERGSGTRKRSDQILESLQLTGEDLNVVARVNDQESIKNLTASGLGISLISERAAQNFVNEKRLLMFKLPRQVATRSFYLVMHRDYITKSHVEQFLQFVKGYFA